MYIKNAFLRTWQPPLHLMLSFEISKFFKRMGLASSVLPLLLSKLLLVINMVEKWEVCQIKKYQFVFYLSCQNITVISEILFGRTVRGITQ